MRALAAVILATMALCLSGCGRPDSTASTSTSTDQTKGAPDASDAKKNQPSLADDGTLVLPNETRAAMGITTSVVTPKAFAVSRRLQFQIFREADEKPLPGLIYRAGFAYGLALVDGDQAFWKVGQEASLQSASPSAKASMGRIVEIDTLPGSAGHQDEVVLEIRDDSDQFELSQSCSASFTIGSVSNALIIPQSALLSASSGTFVYLQTPDGFKRTSVKTGTTSEDEVQVLEGVKAGDIIVTHPVQTLWLTELKLQSGGGE